jgi:hypothetical protein
MTNKRRWETLLMNGSGERLQSGKGDFRARRSAQANGISLLRISGIYVILHRRSIVRN